MDFSIVLLRMVCFTSTESYFERILLVYKYSFQIQLPHLESGQSLNCLIDDRLMNIQACSLWVDCPVAFVNLKKRSSEKLEDLGFLNPPNINFQIAVLHHFLGLTVKNRYIFMLCFSVLRCIRDPTKRSHAVGGQPQFAWSKERYDHLSSQLRDTRVRITAHICLEHSCPSMGDCMSYLYLIRLIDLPLISVYL